LFRLNSRQSGQSHHSAKVGQMPLPANFVEKLALDRGVPG
jgi:hypothetical protein